MALKRGRTPPGISWKSLCAGAVRRFCRWKLRFNRSPIEASEAPHLRLGKLGEDAAFLLLKASGYRVLLRNHREGHAEIDLIARQGNILVFVEVKARDMSNPLRPSQAVDARKRKMLSEAAIAYLRRLEYPPISFRFDIIEVICQGGRVVETRHLEDAFQLTIPCHYYR